VFIAERENRVFEILPESKMTFNELSEWYLNQESVKSLASYEIIIMKLKEFNKHFGSMIISDIKPVDLKNFQTKRQKEGLAPGTIDQDIGKVKTMVYMAFDNDLVGANTLRAFKKIKKTLKKGTDVRDRILLPDEFEALMKHSEGHINHIIAMGYYTGMRKGEILGLTWDKVDLNKRLIRLESVDTKDREARDIPICDKLYGLLRDIPSRIQKVGKSNYVFQFRGEPVSDIRTGIKKACKRAGIKYGRSVKDGFIFHDLRHTFNTNMRKASVAESVIMKITGHSTREMFDRYDTVDGEDTRKAVEKFADYLLNANVAKSVAKSSDDVRIENSE
jgi:integrase